MPDQKLTPEERDRRASEEAAKKKPKKGKVDELALLQQKQQPQPASSTSGLYVWLWILVGAIVLIALAGGAIMGFLGGRVFPPPSDYKTLLGAEIIDRRGEVVLDPVYSGGPAESAGLQTGDVLISIDGTAIRNAAHAQRIIGGHRAGDKVRLVIRRGSRPAQQYVVVLGVIVPPPPTIIPIVTEPFIPLPPVQQGNLGEARLGIKYRMLIAEDTFEVKQGALIISILQENGPADRANLDVGDIIISVDGDDLTEGFTLEDALIRYEPGDRVRLRVWHEGKTFDVWLTLGGG